MSSTASDTIELGQIARIIRGGWRTVVGFTVVGSALGVLFVLFAPPKYTGKASIVIKPGSSAASSGSGVLSQLTGISDVTAGLLSGARSPMETEIEILSSRSIAGSVVDSLDLQARVKAGRAVASLGVIDSLSAPGLFRPEKFHFQCNGDACSFSSKTAQGQIRAGARGQVGPATIAFRKGALPREFDLALMDREDAIDRLADHLKVAKDKGEVATVVYKGDDSLTAARVPNLLLDVYFARRKGIDRGVDQRRVEFLTAKSDSMAHELATTEHALRVSREGSGVLDPEVVGKIEIQSAADLRSKLTDAVVEQSALRQLLTQLQAGNVSARQLGAYPSFLKSGAVNGLLSQLSTLETQKTLRLETRTEHDPEIVALTQSAHEVEGQLLPIARTYETSLERQIGDYQVSLDSIQNSINALPKAAESYGRLYRDVMDMGKMYAGLQGQIVEAKLAAITEGGDVRPLDLAVPSKYPSFPSPIIFLPAGLFGGLILGLIAAVMGGTVGRWVRDPIELERSTGVPALPFDPATPLLIGGASYRTVLVAPLVAGAPIKAVVQRLAETAAARSRSSAILDLATTNGDVDGAISRLEASHDLVIVLLPDLTSDAAAAALRENRPVLLVTPERRVDRTRVKAATQLLRRLDVPCAGVVLQGPKSNGAFAGV